MHEDWTGLPSGSDDIRELNGYDEMQGKSERNNPERLKTTTRDPMSGNLLALVDERDMSVVEYREPINKTCWTKEYCKSRDLVEALSTPVTLNT